LKINDNTEGAIKNGLSRETGNIGYANSAILQLFPGEKKLIFNVMMMMSFAVKVQCQER
jgi:hypothetical protein